MRWNRTESPHLVRHLLVSALAGLAMAAFTFALLSHVAPDADADPTAAADVAQEGPELAAPPEAVPEAIPSEPAPPARVVTSGVITPGQSLALALYAQGVDPKVVHLISTEMRPHFDFRRAQPGHSYELIQDDSGRPLAFHYRLSPIDGWELLAEGDGYSVSRNETPLEPREARVAGVVTDTLYGAITALGGEAQLASDFTDVFAWDIDFSRSVQPGDEFQILYEQLFRTDEAGNEVYVRPGRILAARYHGAAGEHSAVYFETQEGRGGYYRPDGTSVQRQFLAAPLRYARISSSFSNARRHPILKITRPHHGIDYAAPRGTSIWSVADGEVIYRGWAGGFGNLVKVRHAKGYVSYYAHLSRFAKGLRVGQRVQQKQLVGYVGSTGLATGPHVCFRITHNGQYVNPSRIGTPAGPPIQPERLPVFAHARDSLFASLDGGSVLAAETDEAL